MSNEDRLYNYVYRDLITKIHSGKYDYGEEIPTLLEICEIYDISRNTARTAIKLLVENGYVKTTPRKPPVVCFDLDDPEFRPKYLREFAQRRQTIKEIYDTLALLMPDIVTQICTSVTEEERVTVASQLTGCIGDAGKITEQELSDNLFQVYEQMIKLSGNSILTQLFAAWYHFVIIPVPIARQRSLTFRAILPVIKGILKKLQRSVINEQYDDLKKVIDFFCKMVGKKVMTFFEEDCKDITVDKREEFHWFAGASQEIGYLTMATEIISEIRLGKYRPGDILPSYAQLAKTMDTSEKTSRKAIEILNKLQIVTTINGVGTKVRTLDMNNVVESLKDTTIKQNMKTFFEAMHIITLTCKAVTKKSLADMKEEEINGLKQEIIQHRNISISRLVDTVYMKNGSSVIRNMYTRLRPTLTLGYFFEHLWSDHIVQQEDMGDELVQLIDKKDYDGVAEILSASAAEGYTIARNFAQRQGLEINLRPEYF